MRTRIAICLMFFAATLHDINFCASSAYEAGNNTKRRKIDKISAQEIVNPILESYQFPFVIAKMITEYLKNTEWYEADYAKPHHQHIHYTTFDSAGIISISQRDINFWTNQHTHKKEKLSLPVTFYTKTYLLHTSQSFYFVLNDNDNRKRKVRIYHAYRHQPTILKFMKEYRNIKELQLSSGTLLGVIQKKNPIIFNCETTEEWHIPTALRARRLAFSSDSSLLAISGKSGIIEKWNIQQKKEMTYIIPQHQEYWKALAITSSGTVAATTYDKRITLYTTKYPHGIIHPSTIIYRMQFSADKTILATISYDNNCIAIRNGKTGQLLQSLQTQHPCAPFAFVSGFAIAPNSKQIVVHNTDGSLILWQLRPIDDDYDITR